MVLLLIPSAVSDKLTSRINVRDHLSRRSNALSEDGPNQRLLYYKSDALPMQLIGRANIG